MNKFFVLVFTALASLIALRPVYPLSTDQDQNIEITAKSGELDDVKNTTIYTGNVIVDQGSMRITGDRMTVYYTDNNDYTLVMEGRPATYRQLPDDSKVYDEAEASRMEYHKSKNLIILIDSAKVTQAKAVFSGDRIEYDSMHSRVKVTSEPGQAGETSKSGERIKIIIPPKPEQDR